MTKLILVLTLFATMLGGCIVVPNRGHDDRYHQEHHEDRHDDGHHDNDHNGDHH